jgi:hypothetical protein
MSSALVGARATNRAVSPEKAPKEAMNNESSGETTYRTSQLQRGLALASATSLLLIATLRVTGDRPLWEPSLINFVLTAGLPLAATGYGLRTRIRVSERAIRKTRPLWSDNTVRFSDVRRAHLPLTEEGLWLYTDPDGSPDPAVEAQSFERFDELADTAPALGRGGERSRRST